MSKIKTGADLETALDKIDERFQEVTSDNAALMAKVASLSIVAKGKFFNKPDIPNADSHRKMGELAMAMIAARAGTPSAKQVELLMESKGNLDLETKTDIGTPLDNDTVTGTYLMFDEIHREIVRVAEDNSELMPRVREIPMSQRVKNYPRSNAVPSFSWLDADGDSLTEQNPTFAQGTLTNKTAAFWVAVTEAFLEDDLTMFGEYLNTLAGEAWANTFDAALLTGNADPFTGLFNHGSVNSSQMDTGDTGAENLEIDNLYALVEDLTTAAKRRGAAYVMNPLTWDIVRKLKDADGSPLIAPWTENAPRKLFGYDVLFSDQAPSAPAADTGFVGFGNPRFMLHGSRIKMEMKLFDGTTHAVERTKIFFRFRVRSAFDIGVPGAWTYLKTAAS